MIAIFLSGHHKYSHEYSGYTSTAGNTEKSSIVRNALIVRRTVFFVTVSRMEAKQLTFVNCHDLFSARVTSFSVTLTIKLQP